jgi:hypothetical protein
MVKSIQMAILIVLLSTGFSTAGQEPATADADSILIDVVKGKVGDVNYRDPIDTIRKSIGTNRIKNKIEKLEGEPHDFYEIDINGHKIYKHWNGTSLKDPAFKLKTGLGVGAKVKDFRKKYGEGTFIGGEGIVALCFESKGPKYSFCIDDVIDVYKDENKLNRTTVKYLWLR